MPLGIDSVVDAGIYHTKCTWWNPSYASRHQQFLQVPTSAIPEEGNATSHMHLTFYSDINSIVGAYHYLVPTGVGNKV